MSKKSRQKQHARRTKKIRNFYAGGPTQEIADLFGVEPQHSIMQTVYIGLAAHSDKEFLEILNKETELKTYVLEELMKEGKHLEDSGEWQLCYEELLDYWMALKDYCHLADLLEVTNPNLFDEILIRFKDFKYRREVRAYRPKIEDVKSPTLKRFLETAFV